jgi:hypothetical protein
MPATKASANAPAMHFLIIVLPEKELIATNPSDLKAATSRLLICVSYANCDVDYRNHDQAFVKCVFHLFSPGLLVRLLPGVNDGMPRRYARNVNASSLKDAYNASNSDCVPVND